MKHLFIIAFFVIVATTFSCTRDIAIPSISYSVEDVNADAFQTTCVITCKNETIDGVSIQIRVLVAEDNSFSSLDQYEMQAVDGQWRCDITGLTHGTQYYYCFEFFSDIESYRLKDVYNFSTIVVTGLNVTTSEISNITQTTAQGGGIVSTESMDITERGICWSTNHNPTTSNSHAHNGNGEGSYTVNMTGLNANTTYFVRAYAKNSLGTTYGEEVSFTTLKMVSLPTITTNQVTEIAQTTAVGGGNVTSDGDASVIERGICWSTNHNPTIIDAHANNGTGIGDFSVNMTGLSDNTTYYVRAYATNSVGTAYGSEVSFTTLEIATLPTVRTDQIINITQTTAVGRGTVTAIGGTDVTERGICWSTFQNPTINDSHASSGTGIGSYSVNMTGLTPNTGYFVRSYAKNAVGVSYGGQLVFMTLSGSSTPETPEISEVYVTVSNWYPTFNATISGSGITSTGFVWSTSNSTPVINGTGCSQYTGSTTYTLDYQVYSGMIYVRAFATISSTVYYGPVTSFNNW